MTEKYEFVDMLRRGSSSYVWHARRRHDSLDVALKVTEVSVQQLAKEEFEILSSISHPHIVQAMDFLICNSHAVVVLEYVHGTNLRTVITSIPEQRLAESIAGELGSILLEAVTYLHGKEIVHRDIKPENVLVSSNYKNLKLCDFNVARYIDGDILLTMTGTVLYAAPEVLLGEAPGKPADVWCVGVCLYFILSGSLPQGRSKVSVASNTAMRPIILQGTWLNTSEECRSAVKRALTLEANRRPSAEQLQQSAWFQRSDITDSQVEPNT